MAWRASHPDNTVWKRIPDLDGAPEFEIGFFPPRITERLTRVMEQIGTADDFDKSFDATWKMVRYGVRNWRGLVELDGTTVIEPTLELEVIDGRTYSVLTEDSARRLYTARVFGLVGMHCHLFNVLTEEEKKSSV